MSFSAIIFIASWTLLSGPIDQRSHPFWSNTCLTIVIPRDSTSVCIYRTGVGIVSKRKVLSIDILWVSERRATESRAEPTISE
jgi:hypothetical protein